MFRCEKPPQSGRLRAPPVWREVFGAPDAKRDAEVINIALTLLNELGLENRGSTSIASDVKNAVHGITNFTQEYLRTRGQIVRSLQRAHGPQSPCARSTARAEGCRMVVKKRAAYDRPLYEECSAHFKALKKVSGCPGH